MVRLTVLVGSLVAIIDCQWKRGLDDRPNDPRLSLLAS